jgi:uncharacterized protein (DUF58 family)
MLKCRITYFFTLSAAIVFYLFYTGYLSFFTLAAVISLPIVSWILTLLTVRRTHVRFEVNPPCAGKGENLILHILFQNRSIFPIARAKLKFSCNNSLCGETRYETFFMPVNSGAEQAAEYAMKSQYCGKITVELTRIKYYDFLGIFTLNQNPTVNAEVFVLPKTQFLDAGIDATVNYSAESNTYSSVKPGDDPSEIFDIRPFRSGDRLRSIHWKLSSKLDELMVKEFSLPMDSSVLLLAELMAPDMTALDTVVETLASLSHFLLENQINHCVEWYDAEHGQFSKAEIRSDKNLAALLNAVLSAHQYKKEPYALASRNQLSEFLQEYPHLIYITGLITEALITLCDQSDGEKTTVLYCAEMDGGQQKLADSLDTMNVQVIKIQPGRIQECLSGLML